MPNPARLNLFDLLRLLAATLVIYSHSFPLLGVGDHVTDFAHHIWPFTDAGSIGVYIFFTISGYLNARSVVKHATGLFYINRCLRIFPGLLIALLFTVFIVGPACTSLPGTAYFASVQTWLYLVYTEFLLPGHSTLPGVFDHNLYKNAVNGSLWTLRVEFTLYLLLPLIVNVPGKKSATTSLLAVSFLLLHLAAPYAENAGMHIPYMAFLDAVAASAFFFFAGAAIAYAQLGKPSLRQVFALLLLILAAIRTPYAQIVFFVLFPLLVIKTGSIETRTLTLKNDISYGLYIYAFPVQQAIYHFLATSLTPVIMALTALGATAVLASLSWFFVEKPILSNRAVIAAGIGEIKRRVLVRQ